MLKSFRLCEFVQTRMSTDRESRSHMGYRRKGRVVVSNLVSVFRNRRLVNLVDCAFGLGWLCKEDTRMYTGSGGTSLRPVASCSCYLHQVRSRGYKRSREG
jgi:hypothetical protein